MKNDPAFQRWVVLREGAKPGEYALVCVHGEKALASHDAQMLSKMSQGPRYVAAPARLVVDLSALTRAEG